MGQLQDLLNLIQQKQNDFPAAQKRVATYVVKNYELIPFLPITTLAGNIGVSERTVIKFCNSIGFAKFTEFKGAFSDYAKSKLAITSKLSHADGKKRGGDVFDQTLRQDIESIKTTMNNSENRSNLKKLIPMLRSANHIYVTGGRASGIIAEMFTTMIRYLDRKVFHLDAGGGDYFDRLMMIEPTDVVVAVCFSRYTAQVVKGLKYLRGRGVPIVLITDTELSPAYACSELVFQCEASSAGYFPCYAGCMSLLYAICSELGKQLGSAAADHTRELESLLMDNQVFI